MIAVCVAGGSADLVLASMVHDVSLDACKRAFGWVDSFAIGAWVNKLSHLPLELPTESMTTVSLRNSLFVGSHYTLSTRSKFIRLCASRRSGKS